MRLDILTIWAGFDADFLVRITQELHKHFSRDLETLYLEAPVSVHKLMKTEAGGSVWESNPPPRELTSVTGFEVQAAHQHRYASV
jgi:hypothetical protein